MPNPPVRRIERCHVAFYRAHLQGIALDEASRLYLGGIDLRKARSTLLWLRDRFRQAALRHGGYGDARLIRTRVGLGSAEGESTSANLPTLEIGRAHV